jgi:hypothetical protein
MQHIVDPIADWIFDAAVVDISEKGVVETKPLTDEDWLQVERGALIPPSPPPAEDATGNGSRRGCVVEGRPWRTGADAEGLFDVGDKIDKACESCHLEYWYPGDKEVVLENQRKTVTYHNPQE